MGSLQQPHSSWAGEEHRQRDQKGAVAGQPGTDPRQACRELQRRGRGGELPTLLATAPPGRSSECGGTQARSHTILRSEVAPAVAPASGGETQDTMLVPCTQRVCAPTQGRAG